MGRSPAGLRGRPEKGKKINRKKKKKKWSGASPRRPFRFYHARYTEKGGGENTKGGEGTMGREGKKRKKRRRPERFFVPILSGTTRGKRGRGRIGGKGLLKKEREEKGEKNGREPPPR